MVCFHCPTPILTRIPIPIPVKFGSVIMCRSVSTEPRLIPIDLYSYSDSNGHCTQFGTDENLTNFHCIFCIEISPSGAFVHFIGIGVGQ